MSEREFSTGGIASGKLKEWLEKTHAAENAYIEKMTAAWLAETGMSPLDCYIEVVDRGPNLLQPDGSTVMSRTISIRPRWRPDVRKYGAYGCDVRKLNDCMFPVIWTACDADTAERIALLLNITDGIPTAALRALALPEKEAKGE